MTRPGVSLKKSWQSLGFAAVYRRSYADLKCLKRSVTLSAARAFNFVSQDAAVNLLRAQGLSFRGRFHTPSKHAVFVVEGCIFLESELLDLFARNKLNRDGIQELAKRIGTMKCRMSQ
jgi:hypothetical protein